MKKSTKIITAVALTVGLAGGAAALGKNHYGSPEKRLDKVTGYIAYELELDETQKQALGVFADQMLSARESIHGDKSEMQVEAMALISAETFDRARALELVNAKVSKVNEQAPDMINSFGDFLDSLNAEQKAEILEFAEEHKGHRGGKFRH